MAIKRPDFTAIDIDDFNPLSVSDSAIGGYSIFVARALYEDRRNETQLIKKDDSIYLTTIIGKLFGQVQFSLSPNPFDVNSRLYSFPYFYMVNYANRTQSSGLREDTCTFYTKEPFTYLPPFLAQMFDYPSNPVTTGFFEQGVFSSMNASTGLFDSFTPNYIYNFPNGYGQLNENTTLTSLTGTWYLETNQPKLTRWV